MSKLYRSGYVWLVASLFFGMGAVEAQQRSYDERLSELETWRDTHTRDAEVLKAQYDALQRELRSVVPVQLDGAPLRLVSGRTDAWKPYIDNGRTVENAVTVDVDLAGAGFRETPQYLISLHGGKHWKVMGAASVYNPTPEGFSVYLTLDGLTVQVARDRKWSVSWVAIGRAEP